MVILTSLRKYRPFSTLTDEFCTFTRNLSSYKKFIYSLIVRIFTFISIGGVKGVCMLPNEEVINLLKWSRPTTEDPLFCVAQKWIVGEKPDRKLVMEALQGISEVVHSEVYKYQKFEIIKIRSLLLDMLNENDRFDLALVEDSLSDDKALDVKDYACFSLCLLLCVCVAFFQVS